MEIILTRQCLGFTEDDKNSSNTYRRIIINATLKHQLKEKLMMSVEVYQMLYICVQKYDKCSNKTYYMYS